LQTAEQRSQIVRRMLAIQQQPIETGARDDLDIYQLDGIESTSWYGIKYY
jgi:hypothetical protein